MRYLLVSLLFFLTVACGQTAKPVLDNDTAHHDVTALNHAAKAQHKKGNKEKALQLHNKALEKAKYHGLHEDQIHSLIGIAHVLKAEDADQGIFHLRRALELADSIGHQQLSAEIYHSLSEIYRQQSNYQQALQALKEHHRIADKLLENEKDQKIALIRKTYQRDGVLIIAIAILIILLVVVYHLRRTRKLNEQLKEANQIKDKLFTIIGHDLRNPIGSITNVLALMEHDELTADEQRQMIGQMRKQGDVSLEILNSLLSWGHAQLNGVSINPVSFQPYALIENNITALQGKALEKDLMLENLVGQELKIVADQDHFDFLIRNLLSNAIKFSRDHGKVTIGVSMEKPGYVVFSVKDEGIGISNAQQEAFASRHMEISYGTRGEKGTGIGLMLSKEFQKANGGQLWLESKEGVGTTFYFSYPVQ